MTAPSERSLSRGRELVSSGRGGIGNIHAPVDLTRPATGPDDFSITRGREPAVNPDRVLSTGRGGAGNIRSPSRDTPAHHSPIRPDQRQQELVKAESDRQVFSTGRGGLGNMSRSRSRGPAAAFAQEIAEIAAVRSRSASRDPEQRSQSKDKHSSGVSGFLHKVLHQHREEEYEEKDPLTRKDSVNYYTTSPWSSRG
ncbi:hypothetical protein BT96DRAFT_931973 [Gymnopus androsaceus JB14]|uniref:Uncharacterized protein n=1 Tax=Gymnopus androsaceus JB14 TaxID=1447944 RepID=A0A6A4IF16_9AGAR|nr:hypothetical protein BT96DRAFT_931973 [Gymnopus androsaceus JB14]